MPTAQAEPLVERLRKEAGYWSGAEHTVTGPRTADLLNEAATAITALQMEVEGLREALEEIVAFAHDGYMESEVLADAIERARTALRETGPASKESGT